MALELDAEKIVSNLINMGIGAAVLYIRKLCKDLSASFRKMRSLEDENKKIRERLDDLEEKIDE